MILTHLRLKDFRSYENLDISFDPGLTLILGDNAVGKTNLAEAIHYLSLARSWRSKEDGMLLRDGTQGAFISADVSEGKLNRQIGIEIGRQSKKVFLNGKPVRRLSELSRVTNVISFSPSDVPLFVGSPGERRSFLDISLAKRSSDYFALASRYSRLLKERNAALKAYSPDRNVIDALTSQMVATAEPMVRYRMMYVTSLNSVLPDLLEQRVQLAGARLALQHERTDRPQDDRRLAERHPPVVHHRRPQRIKNRQQLVVSDHVSPHISAYFATNSAVSTYIIQWIRLKLPARAFTTV